MPNVKTSIFLVFYFFLGKNALSQEVLLMDIEISGNKRTKESTLLREVLISKGNKYSLQSLDSLIQLSKNLLWNLKLFNAVSFSTHFLDSNRQKVKVGIKVVERWYLWPWPFIESADRNVNQWIQFNLDPQRTNYGLYLFLVNLRGRNETLKFTISEGYTKSLGAEYQIPNIDKNKKWSAKAKIFQRRNEEIWYNTLGDELLFFREIGKEMIVKKSAETMIEFRPRYFYRNRLLVKYEDVQVDDTVLKSLNNHFIFNDGSNKQKTIKLSYQLEYDQRNNKFFPTSGKYFSIENQWIKFLNAAKPSIWQSKVELFYGREGKGKWGAMTNIKAKLSSAYQPYYFYKSLGYKDLLRGYENKVMDGAHFVSNQNSLYYKIVEEKVVHLKRLNIENYKFIPFKLLATANLDHGYVHNRLFRQGNQLCNTYLLGYGIGLHFLFWNDRVFKMEYSANRTANPYLYFSFLSTF